MNFRCPTCRVGGFKVNCVPIELYWNLLFNSQLVHYVHLIHNVHHVHLTHCVQHYVGDKHSVLCAVGQFRQISIHADGGPRSQVCAR